MKIAHADYRRRLLGLTVLSVSSLLALSSARGELLFSDSFDYPAGDLDGQGPPPGSPPGQGGWVANNHEPLVAEFGLDFPGIFTAGNSGGLGSNCDTVSLQATDPSGPAAPELSDVWTGVTV